MLFRIVIFSILILTFSAAYAQLDTLWTFTYNGGFLVDFLVSIDKTGDQGIAFCGYSVLWPDMYLSYIVKLDAAGQMLWEKSYFDCFMEIIYDGHSTSDGGFGLVGIARENTPADFYMRFIKTDSNGDTLWTKKFGEVDEYIGTSFSQLDEDGFILVADKSEISNDLIVLFRLNSSGDSLWSNIAYESEDNYSTSICTTNDNGFMIAGGVSYNNPDAMIIKTDESGNLLWMETYGGNDTDYFEKIIQTMDGGFAMTGRTESYGAGEYDIYTVKTDSHGNEEWSATFGGADNDYGYSIYQTSEGGYIVCGATYSFGAGGSDLYIVKTDSAGNMIWDMTKGNTDYDYGSSILQLTNGDLVAGGMLNSSSAWLICFDNDTHVLNNGIMKPPSEFALYPSNPNPFNQSTVISYQLPVSGAVSLLVYDITGREVAKLVDGYQNAGDHEVIFDVGNLSSGIYFAQLSANGQIQSQKLVLMK